MNEKIVLIGAGSAMFTRGLVADLIQRKWDVELALVDIDPEALAVAEGLTRKMCQRAGSKMKVSGSTNRRDVLRGATAVICTVGVGGRRGWEKDVFIPRKYGIFQPVGDSVNVGGTSRSLRMIPAMVDVARDVQELAPSALFFNYGNPMATTCRGVRKATGANIVGLCHGVNHIGQVLAKELDASPENLNYTAVGINHLTWFTEVRVRGVDAMPRLKEIAAKRVKARLAKEHDHGAKFAEAGNAGAAHVDQQPVSWAFMHLFGAYPAVGDRHITEFFPQLFGDGSYYGKKLGVDAYSFEQTIHWGDKIYAEMKKEALSPEPLSEDYMSRFGGEHEQVTDIIESIRKSDGKVYSVNLPNHGQVPNLPEDAVIECPAIADGGRLKPLQQAPLDPALVGTLATRLAWVETTVEAALSGSRDRFVQALILDGAVKSIDEAYKLADELIEAHRPDLPQFRK
ncbi:MAG TPA: hypothetical protein VEJ63_08110 [Planctomycetota bacterium]|nr:hypothetical protein [Planctomycetota bacterium]